MNTIRLLLTRQPVASFCTLTVSLSFATYWLPLPRVVLPFLLVLLPALMAIALTAITEGSVGVRALLAKVAQWRIKPKWLLTTLLLALGIRLAISLVALLLGLISAIQVRPVSVLQVLMLAMIFTVSAVPEELGWRAYALPRLLTHHSALATSLIIGVLWGSLHLVLLLPGMMNEGVPPLPTVLALVGVSVLLTWLYINNDGNITLTTLFHAAQSFFVIVNEGIPLTQQMWLMAGVYSASALIIVLLTGPTLVRKPSVQVKRMAVG